MKMSTNACLLGMSVIAALSAMIAPAYADFVLVTTTASYDDPTWSLVHAATIVDRMFNEMVKAGAGNTFLDILEHELDLKDGEWIVTTEFVLHVPNSANNEAVAAVAVSYSDTSAYIMKKFMDKSEIEPIEDDQKDAMNVFGTSIHSPVGLKTFSAINYII